MKTLITRFKDDTDLIGIKLILILALMLVTIIVDNGGY